METTELKNRIRQYVEIADERLLKIINAIIDQDEKENDVLSDQTKLVLEARLQWHKENPSNGKSWHEIRANIKKEHGI